MNCFFSSREPAKERAGTNSDQWPGHLGIYMALLEKDDLLSFLKDQGPILPGLA